MKPPFSPHLLLLLPLVLSSALHLPTPSPWDVFRTLSDVHVRDRNPALIVLKRYLSHFGYLPTSSNFTDSFDELLQTALLTYQRNFNLNATGTVNLATINQLISPRCGVPDIVNGTSAMRGRGLFEYFPGAPVWPRRSLTYAFTSTSGVNIDGATLRTVFARAFSRWAAASTLTFREVESVEDADIKIGFFGRSHGDAEQFDGELGTLAHAFSPPNGRFHLDAGEQWVASGDVTMATSEVAVDLESVAVHEIGHLLGLGHSTQPEAIMFPTIRTRTRKVELTSDDVAGIQGLYGGNPNVTGSLTRPGTVTAPAKEGNGGGGRLVGLRRLLAVAAVGLVIF